MARVLKGSHSFTYTPLVHSLTERTIPVFAFPAEAGTHLPTPKGGKAELALEVLKKQQSLGATVLCKTGASSVTGGTPRG